MQNLAVILAQLKRDLEALPACKAVKDADTDAIYAVAYRDYTNGEYVEALKYFKLLLVFRPTHPVYLRAAALCLQRLRRYDIAILAFAALQFLEPDEPGHTLALAECQLLQQDPASAMAAFSEVIQWCTETGKHEKVLARAQAMLSLMEQRNEPIAA